MEITLEMLDDELTGSLLLWGKNCHLDICNLVKVQPPNFETCEIVTTFEIYSTKPTKGSGNIVGEPLFRYQNLVDALQKFNEIEEG